MELRAATGEMARAIGSLTRTRGVEVKPLP